MPGVSLAQKSHWLYLDVRGRDIWVRIRIVISIQAETAGYLAGRWLTGFQMWTMSGFFQLCYTICRRGGFQI